jgi:hypothetical protein
MPSVGPKNFVSKPPMSTAAAHHQQHLNSTFPGRSIRVHGHALITRKLCTFPPRYPIRLCAPEETTASSSWISSTLQTERKHTRMLSARKLCGTRLRRANLRSRSESCKDERRRQCGKRRFSGTGRRKNRYISEVATEKVQLRLPYC